MGLVLALGLAAVVGTVIVGMARRVMADERHSVRDYQQTLETLRTIGDRSAERAVTPRPARNRAAPVEAEVSLAHAPPRRRTTKLASSTGRGTTSSGAPTAEAPSPDRAGTGPAVGPAEEPEATKPARGAATAKTAPAKTAPAKTATPRSSTPKTSTPKTSTRKTSTPNTSTPNTSTPNTSTPKTAADRDEPAPVVIIDDASSAQPASATAVQPAVRELGSGRLASGPVGSRPTRTGRRRGQARREATGSAGRGPADRLVRRRAVPVAAAVLLAAVVAGAALAATAPHHAPARTAGHAPAPARPAAGRAPATTSPAVLSPVEASATGATYQVEAAPYTVTLSTTGPCWVLATDTGTGQVLWSGTLPAGSSKSFPDDAGLVLRLGAPWNVSVSAEDRPVQLPSGFASPFDATFRRA